MKKGFIVLFIFIFLAACSSVTSDKKEQDDTAKDDQTAEDLKEAPLETEVLFTYDHDEPGEFGIQSVKMDASGKAITFTGKEDIDRKKEYSSYVVNQNDKVFKGLDLADDKEQDRRCTDLALSPNGDYLVYNCHDDNVEFSVYDMNKEETIYQIPESAMSTDYISDIRGISDDAVVYLATSNDDRETELTLYIAKKESIEHYALKDLFDEDEYYDELGTIIPTDDSKQILINAFTELYLFDVEDESVEEIVNVDSYVEEYDADIFIYNVKLSPDGTYAYYKISENDTDAKYVEHFFHNLESDETTVFGDFDYKSVRGFDIDGNVLLEGDEELHLYNVESEETRIIPDVDVGVYTKYFTLSHSGEFLIYTDKDSNDNNTHTQNLKRKSLGDVSSYETTELQAKAEKATENPGKDKITLTEKEFDEAKMLKDLWEGSTSVLYPTEFPRKVNRTTNHYSGDPDARRYTQNIYLESDSHADDEIKFTATKRNDRDKCVGIDDLDHVDTIDGNEYYFYDYRNKDVEAAVSTDDYCYFFEAEEHSEDEMLDIAKSLKPIDKIFHDISVDDLIFPTKYTSEEPEAKGPRVISYKDGEKVDFLIDYKGDYNSETDIKMEWEIRNSEPNLYDSKSSKPVDIDGFERALYNEEFMELLLFDGTFYYRLKLDIDNDMLEFYGSDHIKETFLEIGESIK